MTNISLRRYVKDYNLYADTSGSITYGNGEKYPTIEVGGFLYIETAHSFYKNYIPIQDIIAKAFLKDGFSKDYVIIHKNGNFKDNSSRNLEWSLATTVQAHNEIIAFNRSLSILKQGNSSSLSAKTVIQCDQKATFRTYQEIGSELGYSEKYQCYATREGRVFQKNANGSYEPRNPRFTSRCLYINLCDKEQSKTTKFALSKVIMDAFNNEYRQHPSKYRIIFIDGNPRNVRYDNLALKEITHSLRALDGDLPEGKDLKKLRDLNLYVGKNGTLWRLQNGEYVQARVRQNGKHFTCIYHKKGKAYSRQLAEIVATYFIPGFSRDIHKIEFKDGNPQNCTADNLSIKVKDIIAKAISSSIPNPNNPQKEADCPPASEPCQNRTKESKLRFASGLVISFTFIIAALLLLWVK